MKKPKIPKISAEQVDLCARALVVALLSTNADTLTIHQKQFKRDSYVFGDYEVNIKKV